MPPTMEESTWPRDPYKGLANYEVEDEDLFAGRSDEIDTCAQLLSSAQTKLLILHGQTGCGKSSFLRAGLIPALERNGSGYLFLKRPSADDATKWKPSFIRCGADPLSRVAEELFLFTAQPVVIPGARGPRSYDLGAVRNGNETLDGFVRYCSDPQALCAALQQLTKVVPQTLVLILDQVEEIITLNANTPDNWTRFARFVKVLATSDIDIRFVLAIRKDHSGQFLGSIQVDNEMSAAYRTFFLADLSEDGIAAAIIRPTLKFHPDDQSRRGPFDHYQFEFAPYVAEQIGSDLKELIPAGATLPVMQIVCRDLYENVRNLPLPRVIEMEAYKKGGIKGRVKQHLMRALREVLKKANNGRAAPRDVELRWLEVLSKLVQREGDGRVHTNVVPLTTLIGWVRDRKIYRDDVAIIDGLTAPELLILRHFNVFAPGGNSEQKMICLGHDMIGIALGDALNEAVAAQTVSATLRKRLVPIAVFMAVFIGISLIAAKFVSDSTDDRRLIDLNLVQSAGSRADNVLASLDYAREAEKIAQRGWVKDQRPSQRFSALLAGLPYIVFPEQPAAPATGNSFIFPTYPLARRVGFASFGSDGVVETNEVSDGSVERHKYSTVAPLNAAGGAAPLVSLDVSDASPSLLLAMYRTRDTEKPGGVVAFPQAGLPRVFTYDELTRAGSDKHTGAPKMYLHGVNKDSVVLFSFNAQKKSIHLKSFRISEKLELHAEVDKEIAAPTKSLFVNGNQLLFYSHPQFSSIPGIPTQSITKFEANDIFSSDMPRRWETGNFKTVQECQPGTGAMKSVACQVTPVPYLQQPDLVVLGLWKVVQKRFSVSPTGFSGYITNLMIVDVNAKSTTEVDLHQAAMARQKCAYAGLNYSPPLRNSQGEFELRDEDVPTFLVRQPEGLMLGYASRTSAVLVDLKSDGFPCSEIYFPDVEIVSWTSSADRTKLMAVSRNAGFVWELASKNRQAQKLSVSERLKESCSDRLSKFIVPEDDASRPASEKKLLLNRICS